VRALELWRGEPELLQEARERDVASAKLRAMVEAARMA
jgi:hypothetical protein